MTLIKKINPYEIKSVPFELKDLDEGSRKVKGYFAAFNIKDSDSDIIRKGAFAKSLSERGPESTTNRKIQHLRQHNWDRQIGKIVELKEDDYGLMFVSELGRSTEGNDALLDYQDGIILEHSIGFNYVPDKIKLIEVEDGSHYYEITEVKLWEGSAVTFGANEFTPVVDVAKGLTKESYIETLHKEMNVLLNAIKSGRGTDERLFSMEMKIKVLQQKYSSLIEFKPLDKKTLEDNKPSEEEKRKQVYINLLKSKKRTNENN